MPNRYSTIILIGIALLLAVVTASLLYTNLLSLPVAVPQISPSFRWLTFLALALISQAFMGYILWRMLRLRQRSVIQTEVLHSLVHEFQTPITAIRMAADVLDSPIARNQPERSEKYIRIIREETERLQQQVETMLTLARADRNTLLLNLEPVPIQQLLRTIAERHGDYLQLSLPSSDPYLLADRLHLTNVLHNLLDNAVKYSDGHPDITLYAKMNAGSLQIAVCDRGVGISSQHIQQIFQPFYRVHDRRQPNVKGFGLGLSYVQRIVKAHNWHIDVKSELNQGSEFIIRIPTASVLSANAVSTTRKQVV
ncbi:two-component system phosphate regulon sensor histidine kinase PhoR [Spirosoma lacussanchae]|uniref:sensor histidine kinase n=1 Tax=Spirosoma lacussanchae TaxID=1884249 RepID=UPI0011080F8B|nr:HAMP domain-containing sensor histidine kinase [Spirosoma lacussanchae]